MKTFKFRIEALLTLRKSKTTQAIEAYSKAMARTKECKMAYDGLVQRECALKQEVQEARTGEFIAGEQVVYQTQIEENKKMMRQLLEMLDEAKKEERMRFQDFLEAKKEEDILVKLKEKKQDAFNKEELKREGIELDDIVQARVRRQTC